MLKMKKNNLWLLIGIILGAILILLISNNLSLKPSNKFSGIKAKVYYQENCGCCKEYIDYLRRNGFNIETQVMSLEELDRNKKELKIPESLYACHTVLIGDYFIEGHIPIEAIQKLLTEKPDINGIALPGMPSGSPGMPGFKIYPFKIHSVKNGEDKGIFMEI
ncbi:MAG: hypothetical protein KatS3mg094_016 [Candidatus Parcubacteria bacterium]|nr:MAG: hypothetical protein KatS3mg094_016 [Candidatus Parcubacteria bacterium]